MIKKYKISIVILILPFILTGCWDYKDLNLRSNVLSIGVDKKKNEIEFSGEVATVSTDKATKDQEDRVTSSYYFSATGLNFEKAREAFDARIPLQDFLGAQRVVVFSKKYAEDGIKSYINRIYNIKQFRSSALVAISKEPAKDFFYGKVKNDMCIGYALEDTIKQLESIGLTIYKTVQDVNSDMYVNGIGYLIPYVTKNNDVVEYLGLAAMKDSKLVGIINRENSLGYTFIILKNPQSTVLIPHREDTKNLLSVKSKLNKRKIKTDYEDDTVNIYIDLNLDSQLSYLYKVQHVSEKDLEYIENQVCKIIKDEIIHAVERSQNEFKCDVFGFKKYFNAQNADISKKIDWKKEYPNAKFHVNVKTKILNTNLIDTNEEKEN